MQKQKCLEADIREGNGEAESRRDRGRRAQLNLRWGPWSRCPFSQRAAHLRSEHPDSAHFLISLQGPVILKLPKGWVKKNQRKCPGNCYVMGKVSTISIPTSLTESLFFCLQGGKFPLISPLLHCSPSLTHTEEMCKAK